MKNPGDPDPLYVLARTALLDALEALGGHREATVLVGAQAIYLHTGQAGLPIAEYTTDADIALHPTLLADSPLLMAAMTGAGFKPHADQIGRWVTTKPGKDKDIEVITDLLVPEALGGAGRRGARLGVHGKKAARKAKGLEAALVDKKVMSVAALTDEDPRKIDIQVAGPTALLIAKLHKISERTDEGDRAKDKDALDVLRLLRAIETEEFAKTWEILCADDLAGPVSRKAVPMLRDLFSTPASEGSQMAGRATEPFETAATSSASVAALSGDLLDAVKRKR